jgi:hypothetical protein
MVPLFFGKSVRHHILSLFLPSICCSLLSYPTCNVDLNDHPVIPAWIAVRRRERNEGVDRHGFVVVLAAVALGEMLNPIIILWIEFCGSSH